MMMSDFIDLTIICALGVIVTALYAINRNSKDRKQVRDNLIESLVLYPTASAGTPTRTIPAEQESISTKYTQFRDYDGNIINPDKYMQFVVKGDSMQFCGIYNNDLIFVKKGFELQDLTSFPIPVVIRRDNAPSNETQYKVRRAWGVCTFDTCVDFVDKILSSEVFRNKIAAIRFFEGDEVMSEDFRRERLSRYRDKYLDGKNDSEQYKNIIISTTFHTDDNKIRFSIHPVSDVIGIVSESFTV
ncbi:MAG: S24 family peptidase [Duncaniella sp.]|nr:S24 family peptidase [Duncaniella sp.]